MNKRYILILKDKNNITTKLFYTLAEAKFTGDIDKKYGWLTTIIDLEDNNIKWQGCE